MKAVAWQAVVTSSLQLLFLGGGGCLHPSTVNSFLAGCRRRFLEARCAHGTWAISSISLLNLRTIQTAASGLGSACAAAVSLQSSSRMSWVSPEVGFLAALKQVREVKGGKGLALLANASPEGFSRKCGLGNSCFCLQRYATHGGAGRTAVRAHCRA
jgi:hypothetical protein